MLKQQITDAMKAAMKGGDKPRLAVIRLMLAAVKQREVDERIELDDSQVLAVLDKMVKQRRDSEQQYRDAGRDELAAREAAEIAIIQEFLPAQLAEEELAALVGLAPSSCLERVRRLTRDGALEGFHARVSDEALGVGVHAMIEVSHKVHSRESVQRFTEFAIGEVDEVVELFHAGGRGHGAGGLPFGGSSERPGQRADSGPVVGRTQRGVHDGPAVDRALADLPRGEAARRTLAVLLFHIPDAVPQAQAAALVAALHQAGVEHAVQVGRVEEGRPAVVVR